KTHGHPISHESSVLSHVLLRLRRPPPSTLFPYTTLFRSAEIRPRRRRQPRQAQRRHLRLHRGEDGHPRQRHLRHELRRCARVAEDRKSTRLNSSHVKISYAVFCLKKKKK